MAYRPIPEGAIEIQTGLWLHTTTFTVGGVTYEQRKLYSAEGYCFYDIRDVIYDEEGNVIPEDEVLPEQRVYAQYASLGLADSPDNYVSVPVDPSYEIVSIGGNNNTVTQ